MSGSFGTIDANAPFGSLTSATHIVGDQGFAFESFWTAHVLSLADGASDKIGGAVTRPTPDVPEPMSLSLFGMGLLGLAAAGRARPR